MGRARLVHSSHDVEFDALELGAPLSCRRAADDDARKRAERTEKRRFQSTELAVVDDQDAFGGAVDRRSLDRDLVEVRAARAAPGGPTTAGDEGLVTPHPLQVIQRLLLKQ